MGREVRMVPANWNHPVYFYEGSKIRFVPLFEGRDLTQEMADWDADELKWDAGTLDAEAKQKYGDMSYSEYAGSRPSYDDHMPNWPKEEKTHYMMYEDTSEGTPISPAFSTPEDLAQWLFDNDASSFGKNTSSYESWLAVAKGRWAPSLMVAGSVMINGVDAAGLR